MGRLDALHLSLQLDVATCSVLPSGLDDHGLPVGLQLVGARYSDTTVLAAAHAIELRLGRLSLARSRRHP
ncbi:MAG: hypothetical protein EOR50_34000 [Mesorhizobium sp.]|nr:MAG: hypothetical protein EOR50_34000 [Mesorhizobium sp.]